MRFSLVFIGSSTARLLLTVFQRDRTRSLDIVRQGQAERDSRPQTGWPAPQLWPQHRLAGAKEEVSRSEVAFQDAHVFANPGISHGVVVPEVC